MTNFDNNVFMELSLRLARRKNLYLIRNINSGRAELQGVIQWVARQASKFAQGIYMASERKVSAQLIFSWCPTRRTYY